jgi:uncharacterized protein
MPIASPNASPLHLGSSDADNGFLASKKDHIVNSSKPAAPTKPETHDMQRGDLVGASVPAKTKAVPTEGLTAAQLLRRSLDTFLAKDIKGWVDFCDNNIVVEFPFAPDAAARRIVGRAAIYEYLRNYPNVIDIKSTPTMVIHGTDDPNVAIAEWSVSGRVISSGNPYEMSYATFVAFQNGLIVSYREYWNPMAFTAAMNGESF